MILDSVYSFLALRNLGRRLQASALIERGFVPTPEHESSETPFSAGIPLDLTQIDNTLTAADYSPNVGLSA
jgi:hypothetical protein